jgi:hypothetical protein
MKRTAQQSVARVSDLPARTGTPTGRGRAIPNPIPKASTRQTRAPKAPPKAAYRIASGMSNLFGRAHLNLLPSAPAIMEATATAMATLASLGVAAELNLADKLREGPCSIEELAAATGADAGSLLRIVRLLSSQGFFRLKGRTVALSRLAQALRSDHPQSMRAWARMVCSPLSWEPFGVLTGCVRSGLDGYRSRDQGGLFDWLAARPGDSAIFEAGMSSASALDNPAIVAGYNFSSIGSLVDVGGGLGSTLAAILRHYPKLQGILVDQAEVIERARQQWPTAYPDLAGQVTFIAGDIFRSVPPGHDAYFMKSIIHDWDDADALRILRACRAAMGAGSRLLIAEMIVEPDNSPHPAKVLDVAMLALTGGKERMATEYADLLEQAGLSLRGIIRTASPRSVIEATIG